jgi:hypothetical protein
MKRNPATPRKGIAQKIMRVKVHLTANAIAIPQINIPNIITKLPTFYPIAL